VAAMTAAARAIRTVEVTVAAASRTADGVAVAAGEAIALLDGRLMGATVGRDDALLAGLEAAEVAAGSLITIYGGEGISDEELDAVRERVAARFAKTEVEAIGGGQPLYPFIASVE